jgi:hypothetical protein
MMGARPLLVCTCIVFLALLATSSSAQPQPPAYSLQRLLAVSGDRTLPAWLSLMLVLVLDVVVSCCITLTLVVQRTCC